MVTGQSSLMSGSPFGKSLREQVTMKKKFWKSLTTSYLEVLGLDLIIFLWPRQSLSLDSLQYSFEGLLFFIERQMSVCPQGDTISQLSKYLSFRKIEKSKN
mmetsp:Transcript_34876/g.39543  ORF Transcript_34876/g.39543 Transcript_34876/m.39543 type:complete len:101 (-) Transcript_34876:7-309(-)